ncbi:Indole-3-glycerol phosphate synthase [Geodia barretti]|uniref:indole-3-glycerol-phosphate synthase n=1 Tax=Geodia barretti TaxID=519541 RepID=A0AA35S2L7_GEOBA|nr:Indole-3-glycerol phosphate synthase [Geodia barretti]
MPSILDEIVAKKRDELAASVASTPMAALRDMISRRPTALDFPGALRKDGISLIAESSPDSHFLGEPAHLTAVKESGASADLPVLRKDFIFDEYQVYEARAIGADTYLLIVDILSAAQLSELIALGKSLGMTPLVETHDADEIATAADAGAEVIGINNRNLHTFVTDLATTEQLARFIPAGKVIVSESGISTPDDLARLEPFQVDAVLVGEALVTAEDTGAKVRALSGVALPTGR